MLQALLRFISLAGMKPRVSAKTPSKTEDRVVLYARVEQYRGGPRQRAAGAAADGAGRRSMPAAAARTAAKVGDEAVNHRARLMAMRIEHTRLCSPKRSQRLSDLGVITAGDLATADLRKIAAGFARPHKAEGILKRYRRAIRLAAAVPGMMPRDAQLLISIHRRSVRGLALESAAALHRDLERFAESSPGRQLLRGRRLPSIRRLKRWIAACQAHAGCRPIHVPAI